MLFMTGEIDCATKYIQNAWIYFLTTQFSQVPVHLLRVGRGKFSQVAKTQVKDIPGNAFTNSRDYLK